MTKGDLIPFGLCLEMLRLRSVVCSKLVVKWAFELSDLNPKIHLTLQLSVYFYSVFVTIWIPHEVDCDSSLMLSPSLEPYMGTHRMSGFHTHKC